MKTCTKCGETKPKTEFSKDASRRDGLQNRCKVCNRIAASAWAAANPCKVMARSIARYAADARKELSRNKEWRAANQDKIKAAKAAWRVKNPEARRIHNHNRRARKRANGGKLSPCLADKLFKLQHGKCACCHASIADGSHLDHVIPLALGGLNEDWNMQLLCPPCNLSKGAKHPVDFMQSRGLLL